MILVLLLVLLSIHCIRQVYKAIKNKDLDILDRTGVPRGTIGRKVSGFMLGVGGVGLFCGRGHLQTRGKQGETRENKGKQGKTRGKQGENKGNQEESRENKGKQGKQEESRGVKGSQGDQCEPRKNEMK